MMDVDHVRNRFTKHLNGRIGNIYLSSGRTSLIGEHTDYNGEFMFSGVVDKGIMAGVRPNGTNTVMCYVIDMRDRAESKIDDPGGPRTDRTRYVYGMMQEMEKLGVDVKGFNTTFSGGVPLGVGTSSSAALESCLALALDDLFDDNKVSKWDMASAGQATEHKYVGVSCGVMDQLAGVFGQGGKLMRLDCRSHEFEYFPFNPEGYRLMLVNSYVRHGLVGLPYNDHRKPCENAIKHTAAKYPSEKFETLRDCIWEQLEAVEAEVGEEDHSRARFILGEKDHVLAACDALEADDYGTVDKGVCEIYEGLSKDYEVSCGKPNFLNGVAKENGVTGSRIMSGDFGGCIINLVKDEIRDKFVANVTEEYPTKFGEKPKIYDVVINQGSYKVY